MGDENGRMDGCLGYVWIFAQRDLLYDLDKTFRVNHRSNAPDAPRRHYCAQRARHAMRGNSGQEALPETRQLFLPKRRARTHQEQSARNIDAITDLPHVMSQLLTEIASAAGRSSSSSGSESSSLSSSSSSSLYPSSSSSCFMPAGSFHSL